MAKNTKAPKKKTPLGKFGDSLKKFVKDSSKSKPTGKVTLPKKPIRVKTKTVVKKKKG